MLEKKTEHGAGGGQMSKNHKDEDDFCTNVQVDKSPKGAWNIHFPAEIGSHQVRTSDKLKDILQ